MDIVQETGNKKYRMLCALIAFVSALALPHFFAVNTSYYAYSNSLVSLFACIAMYILYKKAFAMRDRRLTVLSIIIGLMYSVMMYAGNSLLLNDTTGFADFHSWIWILLGAPLFTAVVMILLVKICDFGKAANQQNGNHRKEMFFLFWLLIFLAWVPGLIASYPGIFANDSVYQLGYYQKHAFYLHHPLIHTYILGFFVETVGGWLHSREQGMLCYSLFQMLCLSAFFAGILSFLRERQVMKWVRMVVLLTMMFLPTNPLMAFSSTKDILYAVFFGLLAILLFKIAEEPTRMANWKFGFAFVLVSFFQMAFRSQGKYVFLLTVFFCIWFLRKYWKRFLCLVAITMVLFSVYSGPVTKALGGIPMTTKMEYMSVPCVQLSRVMRDRSYDLTEEEKEKIAFYIPDYKAYEKLPAISDPLKATYNDDAFQENPKDFLVLWMEEGKAHPLVYVDAWARLSIGFWYPDMNYRDPGAYHPYWPYESTPQYEGLTTVGRKTPKQMQWLADFYQALTYENTYQNIPVVSLMFSSGILFWILLFYIAYCFYMKKYRYLFPAFLLFWLWVSMMFGPVMLYRYIYPMVVCVPILIGIMLGKSNDKSTVTGSELDG